MGKLDGKVAVVTGGNSGIGLATAHLFQREGATVIVTARNQQRLEESKAAVGEGIEIFTADVGHVDQIEALFEHVGNKHGRVDIVFANAGLGTLSPFDMVEEDYFDRMITVNLKGAFFCVRKALPWMKEGGSVIFNTSIANTKGYPNSSVYSATKSGLRSLARTLTSELLPRGIRVNAVSPGIVITPMFGKLGMSMEEGEALAQSMSEAAPIQRYGDPQEIASTVLFLASDESSFISGIEVVADGGLSQV